MRWVCLGRNGMVAPVRAETLYNIMLYGLMGEELISVITIPFMASGHSRTQGMTGDCKLEMTPTQKATDIVEQSGIKEDEI